MRETNYEGKGGVGVRVKKPPPPLPLHTSLPSLTFRERKTRVQTASVCYRKPDRSGCRHAAGADRSQKGVC